MRHISATALALVLALSLASAESRVDPPAYELKLVSVGEEPTEYLFVVGTCGFRSVETLKAFLARLPAGTRLTWSPGCIRSGNEPLLSSEYEMEEFRRFCAERGIDFVLVPSG
jgi:hypothetical protein